jgi:hypothetical protein
VDYSSLTKDEKIKLANELLASAYSEVAPEVVVVEEVKQPNNPFDPGGAMTSAECAWT